MIRAAARVAAIVGALAFALASPSSSWAGTGTTSVSRTTQGNGSAISATFTVGSSTNLVLSITSSSYGQAGCVKLYVSSTLWTGRNDASIPGCHLINGNGTFTWTDAIASGGPAYLVVDNLGSFQLTGTAAWDDGIAPTPTPTPVPTPTPTPVPTPTPAPAACGTLEDPCLVALVDEDRERLELGTFSTVVVGSIGVLTGSALLFARGIRRG